MVPNTLNEMFPPLGLANWKKKIPYSPWSVTLNLFLAQQPINNSQCCDVMAPKHMTWYVCFECIPAPAYCTLRVDCQRLSTSSSTSTSAIFDYYPPSYAVEGFVCAHLIFFSSLYCTYSYSSACYCGFIIPMAAQTLFSHIFLFLSNRFLPTLFYFLKNKMPRACFVLFTLRCEARAVDEPASVVILLFRKSFYSENNDRTRGGLSTYYVVIDK